MSESGFSKNVIALAITLAIVISGIAAAVWFVLEKGPADQLGNLGDAATNDSIKFAHAIGEEVRKTIGATPQITVSDHVVVGQSSPIAELATVKREVSADYAWNHEQFYSTKNLELRGGFLAKAGFDLKKPIKIAISEEQGAKRIRVDFPAPALLSLERTDFHILKDENGWWNKISAQDRENAESALKDVAQKNALAAGMLNDAKKNLALKLQPILENAAGKNVVIEFHFADEPSSAREFSASPAKVESSPVKTETPEN